MRSLLFLVASLSGLTAAFGIHRLFGWFRRRCPLPAVILGAGATTITLLVCFESVQAFFAKHDDTYNVLGAFWDFLAFVLGVLLLVCAVLGRTHRRRFGISWPKAFAVVMAEAAAAVGLGMLLNANLYSIADIVRGGNSETGAILNSYELTRFMLGFFDWTLLVGLILLESVNFSRFRRTKSKERREQT